LLVIAPWTRLWEHNVLTGAVPGLAAVLASLFVRGAVSGIGLVTIVGGLRDLASVLFARPPSDVSAPPAGGPVP
jgi:hypothetical protein